MTITEKQRAARDMVGSSDLAALLNMCPYRNAADVYAGLVYELAPEAKLSKAIEIGNYMEDPLLRFAADRLGKIRRNQTRRVKGHQLRVIVDGILVAENEPVEAKATAIMNIFTGAQRDQWGDEHTTEVPDAVAIQSHGHMLALTEDVGALKGYPERCHVPAMIGGRGFCLFFVEFDRDVAAYILEAVDTFWNEHIIPRVPPPDVTPSMQTLKRIPREPGSIIELDDPGIPYDIDTIDDRKARIKTMTATVKACQAAIIDKLGDAESGRLPDGQLVHYKEIQRKGYTVEPSAYRKLVTEKAPKLLEAT